jgi:hypothetical protein
MKCPRCGVEIAEDKLAMPNRCPDWRCPTMSDEVRWRMRGQDAVKSDEHPGVTGDRATQLSNDVRRKEPEKEQPCRQMPI